MEILREFPARLKNDLYTTLCQHLRLTSKAITHAGRGRKGWEVPLTRKMGGGLRAAQSIALCKLGLAGILIPQPGKARVPEISRIKSLAVANTLSGGFPDPPIIPR